MRGRIDWNSSEIVEHAGLALGTFYQHLRSKKQLLLALMDDLLEALAGLKLDIIFIDPRKKGKPR